MPTARAPAGGMQTPAMPTMTMPGGGRVGATMAPGI
jgi:hypothetical protein